MLYSIDFRNLKNFFKQNAPKKTQTKLETCNNKSHQNYRINVLFVFTLFTLTISLYFGWGIINNPQSNPDSVKFAFTLISSIVSGLVGFVTGKAIG